MVRPAVDVLIYDEGENLVPEVCHVMRDAGAASMREPPTQWDAIDDALDASFPASDPLSFTPKIA